MVKAKAGGIILGGLAGYLILSKGINMLSGMVKNVCTAREWKNYYKYGKEGNMCPPGYYKHTTVKEDGTKEEYGTQEAQRRDAEEAQKKASQTASDGSFGASFAKAIVDAFADGLKDKMGSKGPEKGNSEASEGSHNDAEPYDKVFCPKDCVNCDVPHEKCPFKSSKPEGGIITEWKDGEPVAGRYPWTKDGMTQCNWKLETMPDREDIQNNEDDNPLYVETLEDGVKAVTPEEAAALDRQEDMEIESIHAGDPEVLNKTEE